MNVYDKPKYLVAGDSAVVVEFGNAIDPTVNNLVNQLMLNIDNKRPDGVLDMVPSYRSLMIYYDPLINSFEQLVKELKEIKGLDNDFSKREFRTVEIPTLYGGEMGPDLSFVAEHNELSIEQVIEIHSGAEYRVYMLGFSPGFPYLGGMPESIETPRLSSPRTLIPAGSVGIAEKQTGIYPNASPGGWRLIGKTPIKLFNPEAYPPALLQPGDHVKFVPIDEETFDKLKTSLNGD